MRIFFVVTSIAVLASCGRDDHHTTPGDVAGRAAYYAEKGTQKAAKEVGKDLKTFGQDAHQGFEDAKKKDLEREKEKEQQ